MPQSPRQPRRHRMRKQARRAEARNWIRSGAKVSIRTYRKRYGVDQYTAYDDLRALGVPLTSGDEQWAVRPAPVPKSREEADEYDEWMIADDQRMFLVGYIPPAMPQPPRRSGGRRKRAAREARHDAALNWIGSGAKKVNVRTYARRFGVDRYTAYADLRAVGFPLDPEAERWAVRPPKKPKRRPRRPAPDDGLFEWAVVGDQRIWVVGYTPGGMPFGLTEDEYDDSWDDGGSPFLGKCGGGAGNATTASCVATDSDGLVGTGVPPSRGRPPELPRVRS